MSNGSSPVSGIITRRYKTGSIIYFENDKSEYIYILKEGKVVLTSTKVEKGDIVETKDFVKPGEFFGVKSALGKYPRDETAQTASEVITLVLTPAEFERLILKNVAVVKKMLRVFSNQLRRITKMVREVLGGGTTLNPEQELFKIGEYYFKNGKHQQAIYAYKKYMEYYPGTKFAPVAMKRIEAINTGSADYDMMQDSVSFDTGSASGSSGGSDADMTDFSIDEPDEPTSAPSDDFDFDEPAPAAPAGGGSPKSALHNEMDDFLSDDKASGLDDFSFDDDLGGASAPEPPKDITQQYYEAMNLYSQDRAADALALYKKILESKTLKTDADKKFYEKAHFELGRCQLKLNKSPDALAAFSALLKKFPTTDLAKNAYLHIGLAYEKQRDVENAKKFYSRAAATEPRDDINIQAAKRLKALQ